MTSYAMTKYAITIYARTIYAITIYAITIYAIIVEATINLVITPSAVIIFRSSLSERNWSINMRPIVSGWQEFVGRDPLVSSLNSAIVMVLYSYYGLGLVIELGYTVMAVYV